MNAQIWWFVARSSGVIAWALLSTTVIWGLLLSSKVSATRIAARRLRPAWLLDLHRHLGGLAVIFTMIHLVGIVADSYVTFGWTDILVPMASEWKPGAVAFGVVSLYLLAAVEATSLAIRHLPRSVWRWIHRGSFVLFASATYHGILAGTDTENQWFRLAAWSAVGIVTVLTVRLLVVLRRRAVAARIPVPVPAPVPAPASMPMPMPSGSDTPMPLMAAITPLPGTITELGFHPGMPNPVADVAPPPPPPPPPPPRPPARHDLVGVSPDRSGAGGCGPPTAGT